MSEIVQNPAPLNLKHLKWTALMSYLLIFNDKSDEDPQKLECKNHQTIHMVYIQAMFLFKQAWEFAKIY